MPVVLTIQNEGQEFRNAVAELVAGLRRPFVLLAPTSRLVDLRSQELLASYGSGFFDLASNVSLMPSGLLQARKPGRELFSGCLPAKREELRQSEAARIVAILLQLKSKRAGVKAPLYDVFVLTVLEGLTQRGAAERCECSVGQLALRVRELEREFGMPVARLRTYATPIVEMRRSVKGDRRRKGRPGSGPGAFAEDEEAGNGEEGAGYPYEERDQQD